MKNMIPKTFSEWMLLICTAAVLLSLFGYYLLSNKADDTQEVFNRVFTCQQKVTAVSIKALESDRQFTAESAKELGQLLVQQDETLAIVSDPDSTPEEIAVAVEQRKNETEQYLKVYDEQVAALLDTPIPSISDYTDCNEGKDSKE